jgi:RNA polymerase sigma-70 factor (ECF subfamily)
MDSDFLLIRNVKKGDEDALDAFVHKYYDDILKYCGYHCFDAAYAEDLTQETFVRFFANMSNYRYLGKTKNFLYTIARNLCRNYYKKTKEIPVAENEIRKYEASADAIEFDLLIKLEVQDGLNQLSDELKEVVVLYYFQNLKLSEIAALLSIGLPLVKYRMKQAKIQLKKYLEKEEK